MMKRNIWIALFTLGVLISCADDDTSVPVASLTMDVVGLEPLTNGATYEGWIIVDGAPVSTGKFTNVATSQVFTVNADQLSKATAFVISIEPPNDNSAAPSDTKVLSGDFNENIATISITNAIGDFSTSSGTFVMATPTDNPAITDNDQNGVWFMDPSGSTTVAGLNLPQLPSGWKYEGWVLLTDAQVPVTTGKFTDVNSFDEASPYSGNGSAPNYPGEDFLNSAPQGLTFPADGDVRGHTVVISIEPSPDYDQATPFFIKPLRGTAGQLTTPSLNSLQRTNSAPFGRVLR